MNGKGAETSVPVHALIAGRWSPRALDATAEVDSTQLRSLLEAARWAPSFGNTQPARYLVGRRGDDSYHGILSTLTERNRSWAHRASALLIGCAVTTNQKGDLPYAEYGAGLAGQNLVLQAVAEGLVAHQMAGFDPDAVRSRFRVPNDVRPLVAIAVGVLDTPDILAEERDRNRETSPRSRLPLAEFAFTNRWATPAFD